MEKNITIRLVDRDHKADLNIPNEPFPLFGQMLPAYRDGVWSYETRLFDEVSEMCFPDENYDYDKLTENCTVLGAYDGEKCVGVAILRDHFLKYMYLYDLKVNRDYRKSGVGAMLIEASKEVALEKGYRGLYTQGQDNNLAACRFYLKTGFVIGGLDTHVYKGTSQEGKSDIIFYLDA